MKRPVENKEREALRRELARQFYRGNRLCFALALLASLLAAGLNLAASWLMQQILDAATGDNSLFGLDRLALFCAVVMAVLCLSALLDYHTRPRFIRRAMRQYKDHAFALMTKKSVNAFSGENTSTYISALSNDATSIETNYLSKVFTLVQELVMFAGAFALMLVYSPLLTLAALLLSLLPVAASLLTGSRMARQEKTVSDRNESFLASLKDMLGGFPVIKSFKAEREACRIFTESNARAEEAKCSRRKTEILIHAIGSFAGVAAQFGVFLVGAYLAVAGRGVTAGVVIVFVQLMNFVIQPIADVPQILANRKAAGALIQKLAGALSANVRREGESVPARLEEAIRVEKLSFAYEPGKPVLREADLCFEAGKSYAVVGASGSGKSTLLSLLMGGREDYQGKILYDGVELRSIDSASLYELVSIVQQNVFVFNSSIRDNITMFRDFPEEDVERAVRMSGLAPLLEARGADYCCGENGSGLSGGERQRLSIARCLLRGAPVMLVDEATAALDAETAFAVTNSILGISGLTRVVVTHRLEEALLRKYDGIYVLKNGAVREFGSFDELMARKDYFYSLFTVSQ